MNLNTETESITIVVYEPWVGGKFLINCLGLSDRAYLQDSILIRLQMEGKLTPADKKDLLNSRLDSVTTKWLDLEMGCGKVFGRYPTNKENFPQLVSQISNEDKRFFVIAHNLNDLDKLLNIWKNPKIIILNNGIKFAKWRWGGLSREQLLTHPQFDLWKNPDSIPDKEAITMAKLKDKPYQIFIWDTDAYLDRFKFKEEIEKCYEFCNLPDFDFKLIYSFYRRYLNTLAKLRPMA
jgi:hypothetical protein